MSVTPSTAEIFLLASLVTLTVALAYARRRRPGEAATIVLVAFPIVLSVAHNATPAFQSLRSNYRLDSSAALVRAPPVVANHRNLPLAEQALASMAPDATYAVIPYFRSAPRTAAARRERARLQYVDSWLQYWLAPRIRVDPSDAQWLILLDAAEKPRSSGTAEVFRFGSDLLVRSQ